MSRLIIISNRLPFAIECSDEKLVVRQSSGGLVSAIKSYFEKQEASSGAYSDRIWIGSMEASEEDWNKAKESMPAGNDFTIVPIFPDKDVYNDYYNGFSNSTLWPLFHYFPSLIEKR